MNRIFGRNTGTANAAFEGEPGTVLEEDSSRKKVTSTDGPVLTKILDSVSGLNLNTYATRKTVAQGMLDLALLTANASQLKRLLTNGQSHPFYSLLLTLVIISISLQFVQAILMCFLAIIADLNKIDEHRRANIANNILLSSTIVSTVINIIISTFDIANVK